MTQEELEYIQTVCRAWLKQPDTSQESRLVVPQGDSLSRAVELEVKALLTFDDVLIKSAADAETGANYTRMLSQPNGPDEFFDTPFEMITVPAPPPAPTPLRATQKRHQEAMARNTASKNDNSSAVDSLPRFELWCDEGSVADDDSLPKYLIYSGPELLGHSLLERVHSARERSGRFCPGDNYFNYVDIFAALPDAENEFFEAAVKTAEGLVDNEVQQASSRFSELAAKIAALDLYVQSEGGERMAVSEVRLEDLSRKYDDQAERWLYITLAGQTTVAEDRNGVDHD